MKQHDILPFGQRMHEMRMRKRYSMAQLARATHIGVQEIRAFEMNPSRGTNIRVLRAIAVALECSADWLLGLTDGCQETLQSQKQVKKNTHDE